MLHPSLLHLTTFLVAPAFFAFLALAAFGAPPLAFVCLATAGLRRTQHHEAYGRRLLRMASTCALPSLVMFGLVTVIALRKNAWLGPWIKAAPLLPIMTAAACIAYCIILIATRGAPPRALRSRGANLTARALALSLLGLVGLGLTLFLTHSLGLQLRAAAAATAPGGTNVVLLVRPNLHALSPLFRTIALAALPLSATCAGATSLEYLLLLRGHELFGRDVFERMLKLAARISFCSAFVTAAFLPLFWARAAALSGAQTKEFLSAGCETALLAAGLCWMALGRSLRPTERPFLIHAGAAFIWIALTLLLVLGLLCLAAG